MLRRVRVAVILGSMVGERVMEGSYDLVVCVREPVVQTSNTSSPRHVSTPLSEPRYFDRHRRRVDITHTLLHPNSSSDPLSPERHCHSYPARYPDLPTCFSKPERKKAFISAAKAVYAWLCALSIDLRVCAYWREWRRGWGDWQI